MFLLVYQILRTSITDLLLNIIVVQPQTYFTFIFISISLKYSHQFAPLYRSSYNSGWVHAQL